MSSGKKDGEPLTVAGIELETVRRGSGRQILTLHGFQTIEPNAPFLEFLARHGEVLAPSSPGFGHSPRPKDFHTVYDLVHLYLELLETLPGDKVTLVGFSLGGWLAAEIAVACSHHLDNPVLVHPVGIQVSDRATPDLLSRFAPSPPQRR